MQRLRAIQDVLRSQYEMMNRPSYANRIIGPNENANTYQQGLLYAIEAIDGEIKWREAAEKLTDAQRAYYAIQDAVKLLERQDGGRVKLAVEMLRTINKELSFTEEKK